jgi:hypothetical protein
VKHKDWIVTGVGMLLGFGVLGAIVCGAIGYDEDDVSLVSAANLALGLLAIAFVPLVGLAAGEWRVWRLPWALGFSIAGTTLIVIAFAAPSATGWVFALAAELL